MPLRCLGIAINEYGAESLNQSGIQNQNNRSSRKNIGLGKNTDRAVSLVTQHRLNQTQGISGASSAQGNQFSQSGLIRHKMATSHGSRTKGGTGANLSGIQRRQQHIYGNQSAGGSFNNPELNSSLGKEQTQMNTTQPISISNLIRSGANIPN